MEIAAIAIGGALGALSRFGIQSIFNSFTNGIPLGTILANLLGSFTIGLIIGIIPIQESLLRGFLIVGFLGAFTTMSSYAYETITLLNSGSFISSAINWLSGSVLSLVFCWIGIYLTK